MTVFQLPESTFNFDLTPFGKQNQTLDDRLQIKFDFS